MKSVQGEVKVLTGGEWQQPQVREPSREARLTRCDSGTDGHSPDERTEHIARTDALGPQMTIGGPFLCPPSDEGMWLMAGDGVQTDPLRTNTNRWETRQLVTMAILVALGVLISFIDIPLIPGVDWLKYDPSSVAMLVGTFVYGPWAGAVIGILIAIIHWSSAGIWGVLMNIIAMLAMGVPAGLIYRRRKTRGNAVLALTVASVVMVVVNLLANLVVTPIYTGMPVSAVVALILPVLLPFNAIKAALNSLITLVIYKSVSRVVKPQRREPVCSTPTKA